MEILTNKMCVATTSVIELHTNYSHTRKMLQKFSQYRHLVLFIETHHFSIIYAKFYY